MAYDYSQDVALAKELVSEFGRGVIVQRLSSSPSDPDKPWKGSGAPAIDKAYPTAAAFLPHTGTIDLGKLVADKELFKRCELIVLISGTGSSTIDLSEFHRILDAGVTWKIEWVREFKPGNTTLLYVMGVKR